MFLISAWDVTAVARRCNGMQRDTLASRRRHRGSLLPRIPSHENVVNLAADDRSILSFYKALIGLRRRLPLLQSGDYVPVASDGDLLLYRRQRDGSSVTIALNLGDQPISVASSTAGLSGTILLSTFLDREREIIEGAVDLRGNEGVIIDTKDIYVG